jgi:hypothetical protein
MQGGNKQRGCLYLCLNYPLEWNRAPFNDLERGNVLLLVSNGTTSWQPIPRRRLTIAQASRPAPFWHHATGRLGMEQHWAIG